MRDNLVRPLRHVSVHAPLSLALSVAGRDVSYDELARLGRTVAGWLLEIGDGEPRRVGVFADRSVGAYAGVVGACWAGATFVPLGPSWPEQRLLAVLRRARFDALIVDREAALRLSPLLLSSCPEAILLADGGEAISTADRRITALAALSDRPALEPAALSDDHIAYMIFTSGTTGAPKGVEISLGAITRHLAAIQDVYGFTATDRISLVFDLTFDPSILNMFMTWSVGASLHVAPSAQRIAPLGFINDHALTVWNSTPTVVGLLMRLGWLDPGVLPTLRISIFGGETLTLEAAAAWRSAAPGSVIDNVYGPTEATIECLHQRLTDPPVVTAERGSLAIGRPYPGTNVAIVDADLNFLPDGAIGELAVSGPQLAVGYHDEPALTAARFPTIEGTRWYLTGDKAYRDGEGRFHHLGRVDDQIKVRGYRVELGEVESHLRAVCGADAAAVAWPFSHGGAMGIVAFVAGPAGQAGWAPNEVRSAMERRLPSYMAPHDVRVVHDLPLTPHGKIDRGALIARLAAEEAAVAPPLPRGDEPVAAERPTPSPPSSE